MKRLPALVLTAAMLLGTRTAWAVTVAIVRPIHRSDGLTETVFRLYGELLSAGLDVTIAEIPAADRSGPQDGQARWYQKAAERGVDAIVEVVGDAAPIAIDIYVIGDSSRDRARSYTRVTLDPDRDNASSRLAIRALEVLRASFVELNLGTARSTPKAPSPPPPTTSSLAPGAVSRASEPERPPPRFGVAAGAAALMGLDGVGAALIPLLDLQWVTSERWTLQATVAGLGSRPTVATSAGSARIAQQYGVLGGNYRLGSHRFLRPFVAFSAGVLRSSVDGEAAPPRQGHDDVRWSLLTQGSLGTVIPVGSRVYVALAAHAQVAAPYLDIHFDDQVVATAGRPNVLLTLALGAWL